MSKTKANVQYTAVGSDTPILGDCMVWNGSEFVPDSVFGIYTTLNVSGGAVTWNATTSRKVKIIASANFTLTVSNLVAGMSGTLYVQITSGTPTITLSTGKTNYGAGRIDGLVAGHYLFCFQYDGTKFFWNMAKYA